MARKVINVKPVSELDLQFEDGKSLVLKFDTKALLNFEDLPDGLNGFIKEKSLPMMCARVIYIGAKASDESFTYEDAQKITSELAPATITEILSEFTESMGTTMNGVQSELQKKFMEEFVRKIMK